METKDVILDLRNNNNLTQEELANKLNVTREDVSNWELGKSLPSEDTFKLLSRLFNVSINTLRGSEEKLICQCCGMPLEDELMSKELNGDFNEEYCKWCYSDGKFTYNNMEDLINVCVPHMVSINFTEDQVRKYMKGLLPKLNYWKNKK